MHSPVTAIRYNILMNTAERLKLIEEVGEEIIQKQELHALLDSREKLIAYDGFEPSGQIHIAQGLLRAINVNKMTRAGVKFRMWVADWHALANNKLGGDLEKIKTTGRYFIEVWKACGMDLANVEFMWASDMVKNPNYWQLVLRVGKSNALKRFVRTAEMMGREESMEHLTGAHIIYSCMQVADIFMLGAKITQLGMDQRKVNMLAREIGPQLGYWKPVVVSHHMLMGLGTPKKIETTESDMAAATWDSPANAGGGLPPESAGHVADSSHTYPENNESKIKRVIALKMSKSKPDTSIFMTDTEADIKRKINKAYCPEGIVEENPILEYCKYIIFPKLEEIKSVNSKQTTEDSFHIERPEKFGGNLEVKSYEHLEQIFADKSLHPMDLKNTVAKLLNEFLIPVRTHFETNEEAKKLLEKVKSYQVTR